eukprot:gene27194-2441_t
MSLKGTDTYDFPLSLSFRSISLETIMPKNSPEEGDLKSEIEAPHLPEGVLRSIAQCLSGESSSILSLLAMCGVCRHWRNVVQELSPNTTLSFDGFDNTFYSQTAVQKFKKQSPAAKEDVFWHAAKLFSGYTDVMCNGEGISDRLLLQISNRVGKNLTKIRVQSSSTLTDTSLLQLITTATCLTSLTIEDLSRAVTGSFLVPLFQSCHGLKFLHLSNIPSLNWHPAKEAAASWPDLNVVKLYVRGVNLDIDFGVVLQKLTSLLELEIDGSARNLKAASISCPVLWRLSYQVTSRSQLDEALHALMNMQLLKHLELVVKSFTLCSDQLRMVGMLPLVELHLNSFIYKQQPTLSRSSYSHVDNEGVKALVDSICNRGAMKSEMKPLKLSLCGATALTHDAVSALLRLPILTELDIGGCCRIIAMDKMRLVAKVRAGREMLDSGRCPSARSLRFPGLLL